MKKIILTLTVLFFTDAYCQTKNDCNYKIKKDDFEKSTTYSYENISIANGLTYDLYSVKKENLDNSYILFNLTGVSECASKSDSSLSIMFEDDEILKISYTGRVNCGSSLITFKFSKEDLELIASKKIKKIRVRLQTNRDFEILEKRYEKFKENINCLLDVK